MATATYHNTTRIHFKVSIKEGAKSRLPMKANSQLQQEDEATLQSFPVI